MFDIYWPFFFYGCFFSHSLIRKNKKKKKKNKKIKKNFKFNIIFYLFIFNLFIIK